MENGSRLRCGACKGRWNYGVLATRKPKKSKRPSGVKSLRNDARQPKESLIQQPPRNKR